MPKIIVEFHNDECEWHSVGWGSDEALMAKAKAVISEGRDPEEVVEFLTDAGFEVVENRGRVE